MEATLDQKLINLAFDPAASEGEAVNAFLAYRRKYAKTPSLSVPASRPAEKFEAEWEMIVNAKNFHDFLFGLQHWSKEPYYVITDIKNRSTIYDAWKFNLKARFDTQDEKERYTKFITKLFDVMRS